MTEQKSKGKSAADLALELQVTEQTLDDAIAAYGRLDEESAGVRRDLKRANALLSSLRKALLAAVACAVALAIVAAAGWLR